MDNTTTETIEVAEIKVGKTKKGAPLLNVFSTDERQWGTTREELVAEGEKLRLQGAKFLVVEYTETKNGPYTNRYIESIRLADGEECREQLAKKEAAAETGPSSASTAAAPAAFSTFNARAFALEQAIAYFEVRGPLRNGDRPFTGPSVEEILVLADRFRLYLEGERAPQARVATPADADPENDLPDFFVTAGAPEEWS